MQTQVKHEVTVTALHTPQLLVAHQRQTQVKREVTVTAFLTPQSSAGCGSPKADRSNVKVRLQPSKADTSQT